MQNGIRTRRGGFCPSGVSAKALRKVVPAAKAGVARTNERRPG